MPAASRREPAAEDDGSVPTPFIIIADGPYEEIDGKWVQVDEIVTERFILRRGPTPKLRSKTRCGSTR